MLESLKLLGSVSKISSPSLLNLLGSTMIDKGSMAYCLGNPSIARQLRFWVKKEAEALGKPIPKDMFTKEEDGGEDGGDEEGEEGELELQHEGGEEEDPPEQHQAPGEANLPGGEQDQQPPSGKKKRKPKTSPTIKDEVKLHLLCHYLTFAPDLTSRGKPPARGLVRKQIEKIQQENPIMNDKARTNFNQWNADNLSKKMVSEGLENQKEGRGLLHFVDQQFKGRQQTHEAIRSEKEKIMKRASDCKLKYQALLEEEKEH